MESAYTFDRSALDRLPPYSLDAEYCVLSSLMLAMPDDPMNATIRSILSSEDFFSADNQIIFDTIMYMRVKGKPVDAILVREELRSKGLLEEVGGEEYIGRIVETMPSAAHGEHYAKAVLGHAVRRRLISLCNEGLRSAYAPGEQGDEAKMLIDLSSKLSEAAIRGKGSDVKRIGEIARDIISNRGKPEAFDRLKTQLLALDTVIGGLPIRGQTLIAGKPGMGKSAILKQLAVNIATTNEFKRGRAVGIISVEETKEKIGGNIIAAKSGIANNRIRFNSLNLEEWSLIENMISELDDLPIFIVDTAARLSDILSTAELMVRKHRCEVIIVDHAHLIDGEVDKHQNREREISKISSSLKMAWKRLGVAGVLAAQLNRSSGRERPTKENLRDSGTLEQDGDVIILLHREDYYRKQAAVAGADVQLDGILELIIDKNKDGQVGSEAVHFDERTQLIRDVNDLTEQEAAQEFDSMF